MWKTHERRVKWAKSCKICIPSTCLTITDTCPWNVLIWKYNSNIFNKRRIWSFIIETNQNLWRCNFKSLNLFAEVVPSHAILLLPSNLYFCTFYNWRSTVDNSSTRSKKRSVYLQRIGRRISTAPILSLTVALVCMVDTVEKRTPKLNLHKLLYISRTKFCHAMSNLNENSVQHCRESSKQLPKHLDRGNIWNETRILYGWIKCKSNFVNVCVNLSWNLCKQNGNLEDW